MQTAASSATSTSLQVIDGCVYFGGVKAVDHVSVDFKGPRIFGLLGPNGSGKSTLLGAISRLVDLTAGSLVLDGDDYATTPAHLLPRWGIARTFQTVRLIPSLNVKDNVLLGAGVPGRYRLSRGQWRAERIERATEAIAHTGLDGFLRHLPSELSYGLQRRVEIARAISMSPKVLLLDEPVAGMNKSERNSIVELLAQLREERGITQVLVEHDVQVIVDSCDYVYAMNSGRVVAQGSAEEVVTSAIVQEAYLGKRWRDQDA